jgi:hypothetical protein
MEWCHFLSIEERLDQAKTATWSSKTRMLVGNALPSGIIKGFGSIHRGAGKQSCSARLGATFVVNW